MAKDEVGGRGHGRSERGRSEWVGFGTEQGSESVGFEACYGRDVRGRSHLSVTSRSRETRCGMESPSVGAASMTHRSVSGC